MRVMLLVSSLEHGGAERQVIELANNLNPDRFSVTVCSLSPVVPLAVDLRDRERRLRIVEKGWRYDVTTVLRAARLMRELRVEVVHAFLHDAEMVARLAARIAGVPVVVASERNTDYRRGLAQSLSAKLTRCLFDAMIANSRAGKRFNVRTLGIHPRRIHVIHNGVDVNRFCPGNANGIRAELGIKDHDPVVGMIAMFKRQKRHQDYFAMAARVLEQFPNAWFLCAGEPLRDNQQGSDAYYSEVRSLVRRLGVEHRCLFVENRDDMPRIYRACDITVLTSSREGTPNVLLESMASSVPVVATDVADNRYVVPHGLAGFIVPLGDVSALAKQVTRLLGDHDYRLALGQKARMWVQRGFSVEVMAEKTGAVYQGCLVRKKRSNELRCGGI